jgi:hypothetical protein
LANNPKAVLAALKAQQAHDKTIAPQRQAWRKVDTLVQTLSQLVDRDPEQEVQGIALPVLAEVIELARSFVSDDPVVGAIERIFSADFISESDTNVRAADALVVATQLRTALRAFRPPGLTRAPD